MAPRRPVSVQPDTGTTASLRIDKARSPSQYDHFGVALRAPTKGNDRRTIVPLLPLSRLVRKSPSQTRRRQQTLHERTRSPCVMNGPARTVVMVENSLSLPAGSAAEFVDEASSSDNECGLVGEDEVLLDTSSEVATAPKPDCIFNTKRMRLKTGCNNGWKRVCKPISSLWAGKEKVVEGGHKREYRPASDKWKAMQTSLSHRSCFLVSFEPSKRNALNEGQTKHGYSPIPMAIRSQEMTGNATSDDERPPGPGIDLGMSHGPP